MKFLRSIIEDRELYKKLCSFDDFFDCELENLTHKMDFTDVQKAYGHWRFSNLIGDNHLSSNINSIEKIVESRSVGSSFSSCIVKEMIGVKL